MYLSQFEKNLKRISPSTKQELNSQPAGILQLEDNRTGTSLETLKRAFTDNLLYTQGKYESIAALHDYYMALAYTVRDRLIKRRIDLNT